MPVDHELLLRHRRFEDRRIGISEEFLQPELGGAETVAVLSLPMEGQPRIGWVVCHSFGLEQMHLSRLEVSLARALSRSGCAVLRYHGRGYGDGALDVEGARLSTHLTEAEDAATLLRGRGVERLGSVGASFGGMVAALLADRLDLDLMAVWEAPVDGARFIRNLLRTQALFELAEEGSAARRSPVVQSREEMASRGWTEVKGVKLSRQAHDEIEATSLVEAIRRFRGRSLLGSVSRSGSPGPGVKELAEHLLSLGGRCTTTVVRHPLAPQFGQYHYSAEEDVDGKQDVQFDLFESVVMSTTEWFTAEAKEMVG